MSYYNKTYLNITSNKNIIEAGIKTPFFEISINIFILIIIVILFLIAIIIYKIIKICKKNKKKKFRNKINEFIKEQFSLYANNPNENDFNSVNNNSNLSNNTSQNNYVLSEINQNISKININNNFDLISDRSKEDVIHEITV